MLDWKDATVLLCLALVILGSTALYTAAESFTIIKGRVVGKGVAISVDDQGKPHFVRTILMLIENDDKISGIKKGMVAEYRVSDNDANAADIGSQIRILVLSHGNEAKILDSKKT